MSKLPKWFERVFAEGADPEQFPNVYVRLAGLPARVDETCAGIPAELARLNFEGEWSIQQNLGHLADLEPVWLGRLQDLREGRPELRPADLSNARTIAASHNDTPTDELLARVRAERERLLAYLEELSPTDLLRRAKHPRLGSSMGAVDLMIFIAEHDDQHLARVREIERALSLK